MKRLSSVVCLMIIPLTLAGCASLLIEKSIKINVAGVFEDKKCADPKICTKERIRKFIENSANIKDGVTTYDDLKRLGFDPKATNVSILPGSQGRKYILGTENVQIVLAYPKQTAEYLEEDGKYLTIVYPLLDTNTLTDRVYFSKKESRRQGSNLTFVVILYEGVVKKHYYTGVENLDEKSVDEAFGKGLFEIIKGAAGVVSPARALIP